MRAVSENVNHISVKFAHRDDLTAGSYEKDKVDTTDENDDIVFDESSDHSTKTTIKLLHRSSNNVLSKISEENTSNENSQSNRSITNMVDKASLMDSYD